MPSRSGKKPGPGRATLPQASIDAWMMKNTAMAASPAAQSSPQWRTQKDRGHPGGRS